jgi:hypothetical protein
MRERAPACTAVALLVLSVHALAAGLAFEEPLELSVAGRLHGVRAHDLNGDGRRDIIALSATGSGPGDGWRISLFFQRAERGFSGPPDRVVPIDSTIVLIAPGDPPGSEGGLLTGIGPDGLRVLFPPGPEPGEVLLRTGGALVPSFRERPIFMDYFRDWDGDGDDEIVSFDFGGVSIIDLDARGGATLTDHIDLRPRLRAYRSGGVEGGSPLVDDTGLVFRYGFPRIETGEYDGDGRPDLFLSSGDRLFVARREEGPGYADPVAVRDFSDRDVDPDRGFSSRTGLVDLDGDGLIDVTETRWIGTGLSGTETEIRIYLGRGAAGFPGVPDQVIRVADAIPGIALFEDLDGDGRREIVVPTMKLGIMSFVRILTSGVLQIRILVFDDRPGGGYEEEPRYVHPLSARFEISGNARIAAGLDDFDGDGLPDFAFGTRKNEVSIYRGMGGRGNRIFSREPVSVLREDARGILRTDDLNGDGRHDLLLYYPAGGTIRIYLSSG